MRQLIAEINMTHDGFCNYPAMIPNKEIQRFKLN